MKHLLLCFCLFLVATALGYGQTYYVSGEGDNTKAGSADAPWRTIQYAVDSANKTDAGFIIEVQAGTYRAPNILIEKPMVIRGNGEVTVRATADTLFTINTSSGLVNIRELILEDTVDASYGMVFTSTDEATVAANTFQGFEQSIQFDNSNFSEIEIEGNTFQTSTTDIVIGPTVTNLNALRIFSNQFDYPAGGNVSINNQTNSVVNAEYNWWGAVAADSVKKAVSNNVDYSPWLNTNNNVAIGNGFEGDETSVRIDQDSPSATGNENNLQTAYATAQADATLILTGSSQPYPSLVADSLPITLASEAPTDTIAVDTLVIELNNNTNSVALSSGLLLIDDSLALLSGNLQTLDTSQVILGDSIEQVDERSGRLVGNFVTTPRVIGQQQSFSLLGTAIGSGTALDSLVVNRINGVGSAIEANGYQSINTKWIISASDSSTTERNIAFSWYAESDNGTPFSIDSTAVIWRSTDQGATWEDIAQGIASTSSDDRRGVGVNNLSGFLPTSGDVSSAIWTVSGVNRPLPVVLTSFTAYQEESTVYLAWSTASEINSDYFQVERSPDGSDFRSLFRQAAAGDSQQELTYRYTDEGAANRFSGTLYYRLKMVDFDGSFEYSDITAVALNQRPGLRVHADRARGEIKLFSDWKETRYTVQVADMLGRVLLEAPLQVSEDQDYTLSLSSLSPAVYVLRCIGVLDVQTSKFKVE